MAAIDPDALRRRLLTKVTVEADCWRYGGHHQKNGYTKVRAAGRTVYTHRLAHELWIGPIPEGFDVDHVAARGCRHRDCINPAHLEAVPHIENVGRGRQRAGVRRPASSRTHCRNGHEYTPENTRWFRDKGMTRRRCLACRAAYMRLRRAEVGR